MPDITIITANRNGARHLADCLTSVIAQRADGVGLEYIVIDGNSEDDSPAIIARHAAGIDHVIREADDGPAAAINKGLRLAGGELVGWLNADDRYVPGALRRVVDAFAAHPSRALGFGRCPIIDASDNEIRHGITRFKEAFFPFSCRFAIQSINYISQPAMFFRRTVQREAGLLREDLKAAWDYEFVLRLWRQGGGFRIPGPPLAAFRWHAGSISGQHFRLQFREEYEAAVADAGRYTPQALLHWAVRHGIVGCYRLMAWRAEGASS